METKKTSKYYYKISKRFFLGGKYNKSLKFCKEGLLFYHDFEPLKLLACLAYIKLGNFALAKTELLKLYKKMPTNADLLCGIVEVYLNLGKKSRADFYSDKALNLHKNSVSVTENIAILYAKHSYYDFAADYFEKALKLQPRNAYLHLGLGVCLDCVGKTKKAVSHLELAIKLKRNFYEALNYLANIYYDEGKKNEAIKLFEKIPPQEHIDPVSIKRLLSRYGDSRKHTATILKKRLELLMRKKDIRTFITGLEKKASKRADESLHKPVFVKIPPPDVLTAISRGYLYDINRYLNEIFKKPEQVGFGDLPQVKAANKDLLEKLISAFGSYINTFTKNRKKLWDFEILGFYLASVFKFIYDKKIKLPLEQNAIDDILNSIILILKSISRGNRSRQPLIEIASFIIAFWTKEDMLNRIILIREVLTTKEKKLIEPVITRGRAWRKWIGFKAETAWSYPWAEIFTKMPKTYGQSKTVSCSNCKRIIKDFWNITNTYNDKPVKCGDCATFLRCRRCKGPSRHISTERKGKNLEIQTHKCMQCGKTQQITVKTLQ